MRRPAWYWWAAMLASSLTIGVVAYLAAVHANSESAKRAELSRQESDRRWCALLTDLDDAYQGPPRPSTELGRKVAEEIHRLRVGFGCPAR